MRCVEASEKRRRFPKYLRRFCVSFADLGWLRSVLSPPDEVSLVMSFSRKINVEVSFVLPGAGKAPIALYPRKTATVPRALFDTGARLGLETVVLTLDAARTLGLDRGREIRSVAAGGGTFTLYEPVPRVVGNFTIYREDGVTPLRKTVATQLHLTDRIDNVDGITQP